MAIADGKEDIGNTTLATSLAVNLIDQGPVWFLLDYDAKASNAVRALQAPNIIINRSLFMLRPGAMDFNFLSRVI